MLPGRGHLSGCHRNGASSHHAALFTLHVDGARACVGAIAQWSLCPVQVVEILADSLTLPETPVPAKVARLMLASDVLHNSTAPVRNASRYRGLLEAALPDVFESLQVGRAPLLGSDRAVARDGGCCMVRSRQGKSKAARCPPRCGTCAAGVLHAAVGQR